MSIKFATCNTVIRTLFSLKAFDPVRKKATKRIADWSNLSAGTTRKALKLLEQLELVARYPSAQSERAVWVGRKVKGKRTTNLNKQQYLSDAAYVQRLAQSDTTAKALLGSTNLQLLNMKDKMHRKLFNAIVKALTQAGNTGLPTYDLVGGTFYWWLRTTSRTTANKILQPLRERRRKGMDQFQTRLT